MDRATHCPNCFGTPAPAARCARCGFDAATYDGESNDILPPFAALSGGRYLVGRVLGEGGFGVVYAGWVRDLKRTVAIKEFFPATDNPLAKRQGLTVTARPRYQAEFADWKQQFLREAQLLAQFSHPRIVQVHDILEEHNTVYLIMERLEGQTLSDALGGLEQRGEVLAAGHPLPPERAAPLLHAALEALEVLHGHAPPVIHRDLTPHNLFLVDGRIDRLKVLDFGLARLGARTQSVASVAARVGNPGFAAPEQLGFYPGAIGPATDFYTLGATLYTALAGLAPPNAQQRCDGGRLLPLPPLPPHLDPTLAQVIRACLEIGPRQRPQSVAEIRQRLAAGTIIPPPEPEGERADPPPNPRPRPEPEPSPKPRPRPEFPFRADDGVQNPPPPPFSKGGSAGVLAALLVAALGAGAYALWKEGQPAPPVEPHPPAAPSSPVAPAPTPPAEPRAYLTVRATPASAQIRIMNIGPAYRDGIELIPGDFDIEVSAPGYQTSRAWYTLAAGARELKIALQAEASPPSNFTVFRDKLRDGGDGPAMVVIPAGDFWMGSPDGEAGRDSDEGPHRVSVSAFAIGQQEVTFADYDRFAQATGRAKPGDEGWGRGTRPVINVSWYDALAYTDWLKQQTGQPYRLPTEAEWEYAARAGTETARYWDDDPNRACRYANVADRTAEQTFPGWTIHDCTDGYVHTAPVGSFQPNAWGLKDMLGNVWEWTCSAYDKDYSGAETKCTTKDTSGPLAVRGGSWYDIPAGVRSATRDGGTPAYRDFNLGFRLARSL